MGIFQDTKIGSELYFLALVENIQKRFTQNSSSYYVATLYDGTQSADARIWNCSIVESLHVEAGEVYMFYAQFKDFGGKLQLNISQINIPEVNVDKSRFIRQAPLTESDLKNKIYEFKSRIKNRVLVSLVDLLLTENEEKFFTYPAASSMHHNFLNGLAYHTYSMLEIAETLIKIYPKLNSDLLYAGVILHDIGKTKELSGTKNTTYTKEGNLLGHIVIGLNMVSDAANRLSISDTEEVEMILHMIASHHGELEYGSPKEPLTFEAYALHLCDFTDSKMAAMLPEVANSEPGTQTQPINSLNRKSLYVPKL